MKRCSKAKRQTAMARLMDKTSNVSTEVKSGKGLGAFPVDTTTKRKMHSHITGYL